MLQQFSASLKVRDITACAGENSILSNVSVRLEGFHVLMSFLSSIGFITVGSDLKDLFSLIYASNSVDKILVGHAYTKAVRAYLIVQLALTKIILKNIHLTVEHETVTTIL